MYSMYRRSTIIQTFAIKLIYYQLSCNHIHLLSSLICYSASTAIDTFAIKPCTCYPANLLLILSCNQQFYSKIFDFPSILFLPFFCPKNLQKIDKILNIWNSSFSGKLCVGMEPAHFVASSKARGINLLKDINNYLYFHYKDKTITQSTYWCQKYRNGYKARGCFTKRVQRTGFENNLFMTRKNWFW